MIESQEQHHILNGILQVLQRIEIKLENQESRVKSVEDLIHRHRSVAIQPEPVSRTLDDSSDAVTSGRSDDSTATRLHDSDRGQSDQLDLQSQRTKELELLSVYSKGGPKIKYGSWRPAHDNEDPTDLLDESHISLLTHYLGQCSVMPNDDRLPLSFTWTINTAIPEEPRLVDTLAESQRLDTLRAFDADLRAHRGNDFLVADFDRSNNSRLYRVGQEAIGGELMVSSESSHEAPWSRLILYQGMTTGESIKREFDSGFAEPIPYFKRADATTGLWNHIFSHLQLKRRPTTSNPYAAGLQGFHTTFYDIRETKDIEATEIWKHGPLYDHPLGWHFRKCAYTLYCPGQRDDAGDYDHTLDMTRPHWTMLVLAPGGFFNEHNTSFPMHSLPKGRAQALGHCLGRLTRAGAELNLISQGLARISERWADFQSFFDYILDSGDSLMRPTDHDNLLFDDGAFSRSRRYFWAIDCLSEFETAISDNINQWELYRAALPVLENDLDNIQLRNAERQCRVLQNQREYFRQKLASTRALRDA
ncbi:MAG: hypothetical protein Q9183_002200, partial [Haloplaca sp. 2 TL-2023]